jgi:hypothetical protein
MLSLHLKALGLGIAGGVFAAVMLLFLSANAARMTESFETAGGASISSRFFCF